MIGLIIIIIVSLFVESVLAAPVMTTWAALRLARQLRAPYAVATLGVISWLVAVLYSLPVMWCLLVVWGAYIGRDRSRWLPLVAAILMGWLVVVFHHTWSSWLVWYPLGVMLLVGGYQQLKRRR